MNDNIKGVIFIDLDGVLMDFDSKFYEITDNSFSVNDVTENELWSRIDAYGKFKFFLEMDWMPGGQELWNFCINNFLNIRILSATGRSDIKDGQTSAGKKGWIRHNITGFPDSDIILVPNFHQKKKYSKPGNIIIDDKKVVIDEWGARGGTGILHITAAKTIEILKEYV